MRPAALRLFFLISVLTIALPHAFGGVLDPRTRMLIVGHLDGYPGDDDVTAISRFLQSVGDNKIEVPDDLAAWIVSRTGAMPASSIPRLLKGYMHFLRNGATAPPFVSGPPGSARYKILQAALQQLASRNTPICDLGVLMFREVDDPGLKGTATSDPLKALAAHPWMIQGGEGDLLPWITYGLNPDKTVPPGASYADFPVITPQAKAALLTNVRTFLSALDLSPPSPADTVQFINWTDTGIGSWGHLRAVPTPAIAVPQEYQEMVGTVTSISPRIAKTLGVAELPAADYQAIPQLAFPLNDPGNLSRVLARVYLSSLNLKNIQPIDPSNTGSIDHLAFTLSQQQGRLLALAAYAIALQQQPEPQSGQNRSIAELIADLAACSPTPHVGVEAPCRPVVISNSKSQRPQDVVQALELLFKFLARPFRKAQHSEEQVTITMFVTSLDPVLLKQAMSFDTTTLVNCTPLHLAVTKRYVSIPQSAFIESGTYKCSDKAEADFMATGYLPLDLARILEVAPAYFELTATSLIERELANPTSLNEDYPSPLDLVRQNPWQSIALLSAMMAHPDVRLDEVKDTLLQNYPADINWFVPGLLPNPLLPITSFTRADISSPSLGLPPGTSIRTDDEFKQLQEGMAYGELNWLNYNARLTFANALGPVVNAMPASNDTSVQYYWTNADGTPGSGYGSSSQTTSRAYYIQQLNQLVANANSDYKSLDGQISAQCRRNAVDGDGATSTVETVVDESATNFASFYSGYGGSCTGTIQGAVPSALSSPMTTILAQDPSFMDRYELDFVPSSPDMAARLASTIPLASSRAQITASVRNYMRLTGLDAYLPSISTPLIGPDQNDRAFILGSQSPLDASLSPLLRSKEGTQLAMDLSALQQLSSAIPAQPNVGPYAVSASLWHELQSGEDTALAKAQQMATTQASNISKRLAVSNNGFTIGISLSLGSSPIPGISFSYAGYGINFVANLPSMTFTPILPGVQVPGVRLNLFTPANAGEPVLGPPTQVGSNVGLAHDISDPGNDVSVAVGQPGWEGMLSQDNFSGRLWLQQQIALATPNLNALQLSQINSALAAATFPADLAALIASNTVNGHVPNQGMPANQYSIPYVGGVCSTEVWMHCAIAVNAALLLGVHTPQESIALAGIWGHAYDLEFDALRKADSLDTSTSDTEEIEDIVAEKLEGLNPINIAKDNTETAILEKYLPMVASVTEFTKTPFVVAFTEVMRANTVGTDFDDLQSMDSQIQSNLMSQLSVGLLPVWNQTLQTAAQLANPSITAPPLPH